MTSGRFAEREIRGFDDQGADERIVVWIERREGALWGREIQLAPGRADRADALPHREEGCRAERAMTEPKPLADWR